MKQCSPMFKVSFVVHVNLLEARRFHRVFLHFHHADHPLFGPWVKSYSLLWRGVPLGENSDKAALTIWFICEKLVEMCWNRFKRTPDVLCRSLFVRSSHRHGSSNLLRHQLVQSLSGLFCQLQRETHLMWMYRILVFHSHTMQDDPPLGQFLHLAFVTLGHRHSELP